MGKINGLAGWVTFRLILVLLGSSCPASISLHSAVSKPGIAYFLVAAVPRLFPKTSEIAFKLLFLQKKKQKQKQNIFVYDGTVVVFPGEV